jgi:hypothetical protein
VFQAARPAKKFTSDLSENERTESVYAGIGRGNGKGVAETETTRNARPMTTAVDVWETMARRDSCMKL